jgi:penicillin-binding protein 1A
MDNTKVAIGGTTGTLGEWGPERADNRYEGTISARTALVKSKNGATVRLGMATGMKDVMELADAAGISSDLANYPRTYLGGSEVVPMDLALSYTMFANGGNRASTTFIIRRIEDKLGAVIFEHKPETVRVIRETTAYEVHSCLTELGLKRYPLAGKTGTGYNFTDAWFVGYSSELTCAVWIGFDQQRGKPRQPIYRGAFGKDIALPVWAEVMKASFQRYRPSEIVQPKGIIRVEICRASGGLASPKCVVDGVHTTYQEICTEEQAPKDPCPVHSGAAPAMTFGGPPAPPGVKRPNVVPVSQNVKAIALPAPTVIGTDPYGSHLALERQVQLNSVGNALAPVTTLNGIPVNTGDAPPAFIPAPRPIVIPPPPNTDVKLDPPEPLKFN